MSDTECPASAHITAEPPTMPAQILATATTALAPSAISTVPTLLFAIPACCSAPGGIVRDQSNPVGDAKVITFRPTVSAEEIAALQIPRPVRPTPAAQPAWPATLPAAIRCRWNWIPEPSAQMSMFSSAPWIDCSWAAEMANGMKR